MASRFAFSIKHVGTDQEIVKVRMVVQGHTDRDKFNVVHDTTTLHHRSIRVITSIAVMFGYKI